MPVGAAFSNLPIATEKEELRTSRFAVPRSDSSAEDWVSPTDEARSALSRMTFQPGRLAGHLSLGGLARLNLHLDADTAPVPDGVGSNTSSQPTAVVHFIFNQNCRDTYAQP